MLTINKSLNEEKLLKGCLQGKQHAQKQLYNQYASKMLGVCMRYVGDRNEAEHVMIGGMIKVFENIKTFNQHGSLEGWVRKIMVNESLMYLRKNRKMSLEVDIDHVGYEPDWNQLETLLETNDLLTLIMELPVGYRAVFNLYAIEGYDHKEIAQELGISIGTSKSQLSRARKHLQQRLSHLEGNTHTADYFVKH